MPPSIMDPASDKTVVFPRSGTKHDLFQAGDVVGQYRVERVLGAGGMGVVYLVQHTALRKHFALKALPATLAQEASFVARFKREAEMLARLKHGHIVNVTDFGESQGRLYLVLEFVDGGSLEDWFATHSKGKGTGAPPEEVWRLIGQVLQGLVHAHHAGIVHRDLKPANVLLEKTGEAKISDFGLARVVAEEEYRRTGGTMSPFQGDSVTTTGTIVGTIDFMSPEARNMQASDARSDIYAVGVITYYLLTGRKPHGLAQPASKLVAGLDPRWDRFISTCLAEDPGQRYQNAAAALEGLQLLRQSSRLKPALIALGAGVVAVIAGAVFFWPRSPAIEPVEDPILVIAPPASAAPAEPAVTVRVPEAAPAEEQRNFTLTGLPAGALVGYHGNDFTAGADGRVVLAIAPGAQMVSVKAPGYLEWKGQIGAEAGVLEAAPAMQPVPPVAVRFTGLPPNAQLHAGELTATADAAGEAVLELRPGRVALAVSAAKYESLDVALDISPDTTRLSLELKRLPPPPEISVMLADGVELNLRWVPAGAFNAGSPSEERGRQRNDLPLTRVEIARGIYVAATEMTQRQHRALTGKNPSASRALGDDTRPVEQVSWRDATGPGGAIDKLNQLLQRQGLPFTADLPTETEWEYVCRAGTETSFNDGSQLTNEREDPVLSTLAFYSRGGALSAPSPVARFKPNAWGLYDMHGNVAEWTRGGRTNRDPVLRSGNWRVGPVHCRAASRVELTPDIRPNDTMGYRLILRPKEE